MTRQFTLIPRFVSRSQMDIVRWYNFQMSESEYLLRWLGPGAAVNCGWWIILLLSVCSASICIHNPSWPKLCCPNLLVTASKGDNFIFSVTVQTASKLIVVILATSSIWNFPRTLPIVLWLFKLGPLQFLNLYVSKLAPYWAIYVAVVYALKCNSVFGKWLKLYFNGSLITHWTAPNTDNNHSFLWGVIPQHITQSSWEIFILDNLISAQHFIIYGALVIKYFRKSKIWSVG